MHQSPANKGFPLARWTMAALGQVCQSLGSYTLARISQILHRLGLRRKQGQAHYHSPDPDYALKAARIQACLQQVRESQGRQVLLYGDEMTYFRQPSTAKVWYPQGTKQKPRAEYAWRGNTKSRVMGVLDSLSGKVVAWQGYRAGVEAWVHFLGAIRRAYPQVQSIYLVLDNWPIHSQPKVLEAAQTNQIELVFLPTYAPWLNPIEKLWKWVKQSVIHMHRLSDAWEQLQQQVMDFFQRFSYGSKELLHYVGLLPY